MIKESVSWSSIIPQWKKQTYPIELLEIFKQYGDSYEAYEKLIPAFHVDYILLIGDFNRFEGCVFDFANSIIEKFLLYGKNSSVTTQDLLDFITSEQNSKMFARFPLPETGEVVECKDSEVIKLIFLDELQGTYNSKQEIIDEFVKVSKEE